MKKILAAGVSAVLSMAVILPAFADDASSSSSSLSSSSSSQMSSSSSSSVMSSSSSMKSSSSEGEGKMKAKERGNRMMSKPTVDLACAQTAVAKREAALLAAVDAYYTSIKAAMTTRAAALNAAWSQTDAKTRNAAIRAAHSAFRTSAKTATATLRNARKAAWKTFKSDAKVCKISVPKEESDAERTDTQM